MAHGTLHALLNYCNLYISSVKYDELDLDQDSRNPKIDGWLLVTQTRQGGKRSLFMTVLGTAVFPRKRFRSVVSVVTT